ncbi:response regulator [Candidatus Uhrbacteria bacterium]|nr:response regulator [Candidatus Uhrbacteria bacterium]
MVKIGKSARKRKVMVVEDEEVLVKPLRRFLEKSDFDVVTAANGRDGLDLGERERPDLVLLDLIMPVMDGYAMLKGLRQSVWGKDVPVVIFTNIIGTKNQEGIFQHNISRHLLKDSSSLKDVVGVIQEVLA